MSSKIQTPSKTPRVRNAKRIAVLEAALQEVKRRLLMDAELLGVYKIIDTVLSGKDWR